MTLNQFDNTKATRRVLWITAANPALWQKGGEKYRAKVIGYLQQNGWEIVIPRLPAEVTCGIFKRHLVSNIQLCISLLPIIKRGDLVVEDTGWHSRLLLFNFLGRLLKSIRIAVTCHHPIYRDFTSGFQRQVVKLAERLFLRTVDRAVAVSENTRQEIIALGISPNRVSLVPDGFDCPPQLSKTKHVNSQVHILFVGTFYLRKGIDYLLQAIYYLKGKGVVLDLVGDLEDDVAYTHCMQVLVKDLGLTEAVIFHGRVSEKRLWELYSGADIFVLPSLWEGFGIVLLEAMFFRLPIVATKVGAVPELVKDGENGLLVPPRDSCALAGAIRSLAADPALRKRLGRNGRSKCEHSLTWKEVGQRFATILEQLVLDK